MKIDIHCHAVGKGKNYQTIDNDIYFNISDDSIFLSRIFYTFFYNILERNLIELGADTESADGVVSTNEYFDLLYNILINSTEIDGIVLLAFDAVYNTYGDLDIKTTDLWVSNKFLCDKIKVLNTKLLNNNIYHKKFFFGASVNPNNKNWEKELDFVLNQTDAVLIKWIPSVQHIQVQKVDKEFYKLLAENGMPLLSHVGSEYAFPEGLKHKKNDHFCHLETPLNFGAKVIAAHCNTPSIPLFEKKEISEFYQFMCRMNQDKVRLFSDTSALSSLTKFRYIDEIAKTFNPDWLVHGSDFPVPVEGWVNIPLVNPEISTNEYRDIINTKNPLDLDVLIKRAHGLSDKILENTQAVLRII